MVANLCQNPKKRPIVSALCPTLLRQGLMFAIANPDPAHRPRQGFVERLLHAKD